MSGPDPLGGYYDDVVQGGKVFVSREADHDAIIVTYTYRESVQSARIPAVELLRRDVALAVNERLPALRDLALADLGLVLVNGTDGPIVSQLRIESDAGEPLPADVDGAIVDRRAP